MSLIAATAYKAGQPVRVLDLSSPEDLVPREGEFVWIGLAEPDEAELRRLQTAFGLHPLAVEDALHARQTPKVEVYGDQLFVVAKTAHLEGDRIAYGETDFFVGRQHLITVRHGSARAHTELRAQLEAAPVQLAHGVDYVLHAVLDFIVDGYMPIVDQIEEELQGIEQRALDAFLSRAEITRIFALRRSLMRFKKMLGPMAQMAGALEHHDLPCIDSEVRMYFRDVHDHVQRTEILVDGLREVLTSVFEIASLLEQQRQGVITRQLAAWAAILAVPTAIAGIYGMNFEHMPELKWQYGYYGVIGAIAVVCGLLYQRFKKAGWL
ncbi:magnesium and cobalt transport protein CorA [Caulobacter vibrioides]|uniref:Magnesium and cobalt transport protein CorA, putative n=2 Tax=Caulobacter vibrioides TaxID=155892 RepID=Q9A3M2_CAUVC|nr:magnesium and cobalt transport protein CorA [Caulobacter vibrioides]YP_002518657.1 magnesium and cobalt transport protein CorA [Caulobacter vibrioides NA1000]AAK25143.1 magnesium and cobalt transport protein CorA, putative [Caulobacter vibrioides CB15]ACL96749.1 magnesium and cobalt transport protein CorA [Caulobacter vibrioides NA1000]ATC30008.1 magnesium and cobalt transport protein CorA [Caulobacter vibrioides]QXZ51528.1 magnesium and cobalt transport protein CorA [Caulobacter vibrioides